MIRPILKYGDSGLHEPARPVDAITPDVERLIGDMIETMDAAPGIGLAAPQGGRPRGRGQKTTHAPVKARARGAGLPVLQPERLKDPAFLLSLARLAGDL